MSQVQISPPAYVVSPNPELWLISNAGDAFVWKDTETTAMLSAHMAAICKPLVTHLGGLPSLTAILFIIDALNKPWSEAIAVDRLAKIIHPKQNRDHLGTLSTRHILLAKWFESLSKVPADLRSNIAAQQLILCDLFDGLPFKNLEVQGVEAADAIAWLDLTDVDREKSIHSFCETSIEKCALALVAIAHAAQRPMDELSIRLRQRIGLEGVPTSPLSIDTLPERSSFADLLVQWSDDEELGQLASLAISTAATIALPRRPSDPDSLPSGGVSDIVNRGHPERLLATELAADPDLLMARIANGQALYLRRESPPKQQPRRRRVLIENGIRVWGITRVRATAFALAVAASEERRGSTDELQIFTVAGAHYWEEKLHTREGLLQQLERLEVDPHPGQAIQKLLDLQATEHRDELDSYAEPLLIIASNTDRDAEFKLAIDKLPRPYFVARIDREGILELVKRSREGDEILHRQRLVLPEQKLGIGSGRSNDLPSLITLPIGPLRFPADLASAWSHAGPGPALWIVTANRRLLCFDKANCGAIDVMSLPSTEILASESRGANAVAIVIEEQTGVGQAARHLLIEVDKTGEKRVHILASHGEGASPVAYAFDKGMLVRIGVSVTFFSIDTGMELGRTPTRGKHVGSVFFNDSGAIHVATYSAGSVGYQRLGACSFDVGIVARGRGGVPIAYSKDLSKVQIFHGDDVWLRDTGVHVESTALPRAVAQALDSASMLVEVRNVTSTSGIKLPVPNSSGSRLFLLNRDAPGVEVIYDHLSGRRRLDPQAYKLATTQAVRNRMSAIGSDGRSVFISRNQSVHFEIGPINSSQQLALQPLKHLSENAVMVDFDDFPMTLDQRFKPHWKLKKATLKRCEAWLDSRGLLHLRKPDGSELSLVLHNSCLAGWHNQYSVFGSKYFTGEPADIPVPKAVILWLHDFAKQCTR